jgi:hypothetical protein
MKNTKAVVLTMLTIFIAGGLLAYTQRVQIAEYFRASQQPAVPESVGYEDFADRNAGEAEEPLERETGTEEKQVDAEQNAQSNTEAERESGDDVARDAGDEDSNGEDESGGEVSEEVTGVEEDGVTDEVNNETNQGQAGTVKEKADSQTPESEQSESDELPEEINLAVPFTPQAPHGDWSPPFKEACEEASVYMVHEYYNGVPEGTIDPNKAEDDIRQIVEFEKSIFGYYKDTTAQKTGIFAEQFYGFTRIETIKNPTIDEIKRHVAAGRPVIVPAAGRELNNPYYTPPGPYYHMYVIRGYTDDGFITNDPGTRRGEGYVYEYQKVMESMHDYNSEDMQKGERVVIVIYPEE